MVYRVVSTKLTEEEHNRLLDVCNRDGCTPSSYIKEAVLGYVEAEEAAIAEGTHDSGTNRKQEEKELSSDELRRYLALKK